MKMWMMVFAVSVLAVVNEATASPDLSQPAGEYWATTKEYVNGTKETEITEQYGVFPDNSLWKKNYNEYLGAHIPLDSGLSKVTTTRLFWDTFWFEGAADSVTGSAGQFVEGQIWDSGFVGESGESAKAQADIFNVALDSDNKLLDVDYAHFGREMTKDDGQPVVTTENYGFRGLDFTPESPSFEEGFWVTGGTGVSFTMGPNDPVKVIFGDIFSAEAVGGEARSGWQVRSAISDYLPLTVTMNNTYPDAYADVRWYSRGDQMPGGGVVPEPATITMFGLGLLGLVGVSRKRKKT